MLCKLVDRVPVKWFKHNLEALSIKLEQIDIAVERWLSICMVGVTHAAISVT